MYNMHNSLTWIWIDMLLKSLNHLIQHIQIKKNDKTGQKKMLYSNSKLFQKLWKCFSY